MPRFVVTTTSLIAGAARMHAELGQAPVTSDAAAGTPAAGAWSELSTRATAAAHSGDQALAALGNALNTAAGAYALADQTASADLLG